MAEEINQPSERDLEWIAAGPVAIRRLAEVLQIRIGASEPLDAVALDRIWSAWQASPARREGDQGWISDAFGLAYGHHLAKGFGLAWVVVTDDDGRALALEGKPGGMTDPVMTVHPLSMVAKHYDREPGNVFAGLDRGIAEAIGKVAEMENPAKKRGFGGLFGRRS
jgi:hypothetical protein